MKVGSLPQRSADSAELPFFIGTQTGGRFMFSNKPNWKWSTGQSPASRLLSLALGRVDIHPEIHCFLSPLYPPPFLLSIPPSLPTFTSQCLPLFLAGLVLWCRVPQQLLPPANTEKLLWWWEWPSLLKGSQSGWPKEELGWEKVSVALSFQCFSAERRKVICITVTVRCGLVLRFV